MIFGSGYANVGKLIEARKLVDEILQRDNFSWMAMISCYVHHDWPKEVLEFYRMRLRHWNSKLSRFTESSALLALDLWICNVEWIGFR